MGISRTKNPVREREYDARYRARHREQRAATERLYRTVRKALRKGRQTKRNAVERCRCRRLREQLTEMKRERGCEWPGGCYVTDPEFLDFHHRDPATKLFTVSAVTHHSRATVMKEVAKCDVLCKKHHRQADAQLRAGGKGLSPESGDEGLSLYDGLED
jgi:hypothetical protein